MMTFSSKAVLVLAGAFLFACPSGAQTLEDEIRSTIDQIKASNVGVDSDQHGARRKVSEITTEVDARALAKRDASQVDKILDHVKVKGGIPFPPPEKVVPPPPDYTPDPTPDDTYERLASGADSVARPKFEYKLCERSLTTRRERVNRSLKPEDNKEMVYDILYLPEDMVPMDPGEVYGMGTELRTYSRTPGGDYWFRVMAEQGIPCLPFRIRMTYGFEFQDFGNNAFYNYDSDPLRNGILHDWAARKLGKR